MSVDPTNLTGHMPSGVPDRSGESTIGFLPILAANLLPLGGILFLDWDPGTLALVYCVEILLSVLLAGAKATFAQRPPASADGGVLSVGSTALTERRGSVDLLEWLPPVYPRNLPFAFGVFGGVAWTAIFLFAFLSGFLDPLVALGEPAVLASIAALVAAQVGNIAQRYVGRKQYETASPYAVVDTPLRQAFVLVFVLAVVAGAGPTAVLVVIVLGKIAIEWAGYSGAEEGLLGWLTGPERSEQRTRQDSLDVPDGPPVTAFRPDRQAVLLTGTLRALVRAPWTLLLLVVVWVVLVGLSGVPFTSPLGIGVAAVLFGVVLPGTVCRRLLEYYLTYGTMRYQCRDGTLVAYDSLVETPQWAGETGTFRNVELRDGYIADRIYDSRTLTLQTVRSEKFRTLAHVAEPDRLIETFDLPIVRTDLDSMHRGIALLSVTLGVFSTVSGVVLVLAPGTPSGVVPYVAFLFPVATLLATALWKRAYPADTSELAGVVDR